MLGLDTNVLTLVHVNPHIAAYGAITDKSCKCANVNVVLRALGVPFYLVPWPSNPCFFRFPCFFCFPWFSLLFLAFFLPSPRILGVPRREKPLLFWGKTPCFFQKSKGWRVRVVSNLVVCNFYAEALFCALLRPFALFCALFADLRLLSFALICAHLRVSASDHV